MLEANPAVLRLADDVKTGVVRPNCLSILSGSTFKVSPLDGVCVWSPGDAEEAD